MADSSPDKGAVQFAPAPASHIWVAVCLGVAGAGLGAALMLSLSEILSSTERLLLEALFLAS